MARRLCSSALLLLPLLFAVAAAVSKPSSTNFRAYLLGSAGTADADDYYQEDHNVVELVEQKLTNCRYFGCQNWVSTCPDSGNAGNTCEPCNIGNSWTSQFTCNRNNAYGYQGETTLNLGQQLGQATGECFWDVWWYRADGTGNAGAGFSNTACGWIQVNTKTARVGTATARCSFPGGDNCGEPLCNSLTLTATAEVYFTMGYTRDPLGSIPNQETQDCFAGFEGSGQCDFFGMGRQMQSKFARKGSDNLGTNKAANETKVGTASVNYNYEHNQQSDTYYPAVAMVMSGSITSINGQKYVKGGRYTDGTIQYAPIVVPIGEGGPLGGAITSIPSGAVVVTPRAYAIEFVKDGVRYSKD